MQITIHPVPFDPNVGYTIDVSGGKPPYTFTALPSPPNPPGVDVQVNGDSASVMVPAGTPPGTQVHVDVADSSKPPKTGPTANAVA